MAHKSEHKSDVLVGRRVRADVLVASIQCPICLEPPTESAITSCGHTFCLSCITECLNTSHVCPSCKEPCTEGDLVKNRACDAVVEDLFAESKKHDDDEVALALGNDAGLHSPILATFGSHLKTVFIDFLGHEQLLEKKHALILARHIGAPESAIEALKLRHKSAIEALGEDLQVFLKDTCVPASLLPTTVNVVINRKPSLGEANSSTQQELHFNMRLLGTTVASDVIEASIEQLLSVHKENVTEVGDFTLWIRSKPHAGLSPAEDSTQVPIDSMKPLFRFAQRGAQRLDGTSEEVLVEGTFVLRSDHPQCFSLDFKTGARKSTDYMRCETCSLNWVCDACAKSCHSGHSLVPYLTDHSPTWACCYCAKKKSVTGCRICLPCN